MTPDFRAGMMRAADICEAKANSTDAKRRKMPDDAEMVDRLELSTISNCAREMCIEILTDCQNEPAKDAT